MGKFLYIFSACLLVFFKISSQKLEVLGTVEGLSQSQVRCMEEDASGFLWVGTQDGLNRYLGTHFQKFYRIPFESKSLSSDDILALKMGKNNQLWIGTINGLNRLNTNTFAVERIASTASIPVHSILELPNGQLLFASSKGLFILDGSSQKIKKIDSTLAIRKILVLGEKIILVNRNNVFELNYKALKINQIHHFEELILDAHISQNKSLFLLFNKHWKKILGSKTNSIFWPNTIEKPSRIYIDKYQKTWVGSHSQSVFVFDSLGKPLQNFENQPHDIWSIFQSKQKQTDLLWLGSSTAGLLKYTYSKNSFLKSQEGKNLFSITQTKTGQIFTAGNGGVFLQDKLIFKTQKLPQSLLFDAQNQLWVGTLDGLYLLNENLKFSKKLFEGTVFKITQNPNGEIWVGTARKLLIFKNQKLVKSIYGLNNGALLESIGDINFQSNGNAVLSTTNGIFSFKSDNRILHFKHYPEQKRALIDPTILSTVITKNGDMYACSPRGISKAAYRNGRYYMSHLTEKEGLGHHFVYGGLEDSQEIFGLVPTVV